ncbi:hypothetical protein [Microbulbifer hydrolyticus]|uniref:Transcriptional regulator n=1 Tax=Microbulbifer hydrolyticus TaxID=48074 RepID=A0A6P1TA71_9GAMM|nr:hypothetical protein [Microbulbifer hydrolyticus]MBB5213121.1 putative transcriptional regulator [Microbulbifer hydrolyticus]QHQ38671.1 hypothetical protein GTQ55_06490 [Microbulbifer hydrolyticus]
MKIEDKMDFEKKHASFLFHLSENFLKSKDAVALFPGNEYLDEISLEEIRLLSLLCMYENYRSAKSISNDTGEELSFIESNLQLLCELGFAASNIFGFFATKKGLKIISDLTIEVKNFDDP